MVDLLLSRGEKWSGGVGESQIFNLLTEFCTGKGESGAMIHDLRFSAEGTLDEKKRVTLPALFHEELEGVDFVLHTPFNADAPALLLLPAAYEKLLFEREYYAAESAEDAEDFMREWEDSCQPVKPDKNWRFVVKEEFIAAAGIAPGDKLKFIGCKTHLEIWNQGVYDAYRAKRRESKTPRKISAAPSAAWLRQSEGGV
jgi:DNA-binding transcriptional regulator/RsmH inhibitor MraZ